MRFLAALLLTLCAWPALAQDVRTYVPAAAYTLCPQLAGLQTKIWPAAPMPSFLCGQVEQESCIYLKHPRCWNPHSELKTSRENGVGLGQVTRAFRADGSIRFDKQAELRSEYASLRDWTWERRYDAAYQLTAIVEMDHGIYRRVLDAGSDRDRLAFTLSAYNGGESGVRQDRLLCRNTRGCDSATWFGNVALYSLKSRTPNPGYGASAFKINREYITNVMELRRPKYEQFFIRTE